MSKQKLSEFLKGLAEWLDREGLDHNAKRVREAMRLAIKNGK